MCASISWFIFKAEGGVVKRLRKLGIPKECAIDRSRRLTLTRAGVPSPTGLLVDVDGAFEMRFRNIRKKPFLAFSNIPPFGDQEPISSGEIVKRFGREEGASAKKGKRGLFSQSSSLFNIRDRPGRTRDKEEGRGRRGGRKSQSVYSSSPFAR